MKKQSCFEEFGRYKIFNVLGMTGLWLAFPVTECLVTMLGMAVFQDRRKKRQNGSI